MDGMQPPENMVRCVANNYSMLAFWRSWHRSYNLWTVRCAINSPMPRRNLLTSYRYIYIPVGGSKRQIPAMVLVFTFIALWHDLKLRLLVWGWLISLFIVPEVAARYALPASKVCAAERFLFPYSDLPPTSLATSGGIDMSALPVLWGTS